MEDDEEMITIIPRDKLVKQGTSALIYLGGGILLMLITLGARLKFIGILISLSALVIGLGAVFSKDREDKKPGLVITAAGILGLVFQFGLPIFKTIAGTFLGLGAIALFVTGLLKGIKFLLGLKGRG